MTRSVQRSGSYTFMLLSKQLLSKRVWDKSNCRVSLNTTGVLFWCHHLDELRVVDLTIAVNVGWNKTTTRGSIRPGSETEGCQCCQLYASDISKLAKQYSFDAYLYINLFCIFLKILFFFQKNWSSESNAAALKKTCCIVLTIVG